VGKSDKLYGVYEMVDEQPQEKKQSYILVHFEDVGSVIMSINFMNVTAGQALAAAKIIELKGQSGYIQD